MSTAQRPMTACGSPTENGAGFRKASAAGQRWTI